MHAVACADFGPIAEVKLHKKGGYGFIRYERHEDAVRAIVETHKETFHGRVGCNNPLAIKACRSQSQVVIAAVGVC